MRRLLRGGLEGAERDELVRGLASGLQAEGPRHEQIERVAKQVAELGPGFDGALTAFTDHAGKVLRARAAEERERERRYHEGY